VSTAGFPDLFAAVAATSGALTGLLFVALSLAPRHELTSSRHVIQQVRAAAALSAFTNALAVSLFGLVPGTNVGYPACVAGLIGLFFAAAGIRSILASQPTRRQRVRQLGLVGLLMLIFGTEVVGGIAILANPGGTEAEEAIGYAVVSTLLVGIARAWELIGQRDTGILASLAVLTGWKRPPPLDDADQ
jgi:hypothetical protein